MTPEQRIKELVTRQVFYDSSLVVNLNKIDGVFHYTVSAWIDMGLINDVKFPGIKKNYTIMKILWTCAKKHFQK